MSVKCLFFASALSAVCSCGRADFSGDAQGSNSATPSLAPNPVLPSATPPPTVNPPTKTIEFGADKVFHIGDNNYPDSTCRSEIESYDLNGTKYRFNFEVLESQTAVAIRVKTVCGVDYSNSNIVSLQKEDGTNLQIQKVGIGASSISLTSLTLDKGKYVIIVQSQPDTRNNDADDFLVGNILVSANKNIAQGQVTAE